MTDSTRVYYVDTENIPYWEMSVNIKKDDFVYFFVTENSRKITGDSIKTVLQNKGYYKIINCKTGKNALDFQLSTMLGYVLRNNKKKEHIVVSCDSGYAAIVDFWKSRGYKVRCIANEKAKQKEEYKKFVHSLMEKKATNKKFLKKELKEYNFSPEELNKVQDIVLENSNREDYMGQIHNGLVREFGKNTGLIIFNTLKMCDLKTV